MGDSHKPRLPVTVFSDYICPFCYIGDARLSRLREHFNLDPEWCFFEIHPESPAEGMPVSELGYPPAQWERMMANLDAMAQEEGLRLAPRTFTTNSHRAMLLAVAVTDRVPDKFETLHKRLFEAYFRDRRNIGDRKVLSSLAAECAIPGDIVDMAWRDAEYEQRLQDHSRRGLQFGVSGVPSFVFSGCLISGAVPTETLIQAADHTVGRLEGGQ